MARKLVRSSDEGKGGGVKFPKFAKVVKAATKRAATTRGSAKVDAGNRGALDRLE
jgi:hypothetical protein